MPQYRYTSKTMDGKKEKGILEAPDETELYNRLRTEGKVLVNSSQTDVKKKGKQIKAKALTEFSRELGTLLGSGVSLVRALNIISGEELIKPWQRAVYQNLLLLIRQGVSLSDAMEQQGGAFPELMVQMFKSAELSGNLDKVALRMADHYEKDHRLHSKVVTAMIYPIVILVVCLVAVIVLVTFVIPMFSELFSMMEELPLPTRVVLGVSDVFKNYWYLIIGGTAAVVMVFKFICSQPPVRLWMDRKKLRLPLVGKLLSVVYTARFTRTLSSLYSSGLPIVSALQVGRRTIGNKYLESQFDDAVMVVRSGENLSAALDGVQGFSRRLSAAVMVGEETGGLDTMLTSVSDDLDYSAEMSINRMVALLEPMLIIFMAIIVGFILLSVLLPILNSYGAIENSAGVY